jgi:hypothetical protein
MKKCGPSDEPMCETSEEGERLFSKNEMLPAALDIGRRILELFGYQEISKIIFRLKSNSREINEVINGDALPSAELLLGIQKMTGASIDWILTGHGNKFLDKPKPVVQPLAVTPYWTTDDDEPHTISAEMH